MIKKILSGEINMQKKMQNKLDKRSSGIFFWEIEGSGQRQPHLLSMVPNDWRMPRHCSLQLLRPPPEVGVLNRRTGVGTVLPALPVSVKETSGQMDKFMRKTG
jgi:hypothetical protein